MTLQQFRLARLNAAMEAAGAEVLVATSPENIAYLTGGYDCVGQWVLQSTQAYVVYHKKDGSLCYVMSYAEVPSIIEFAGEEATIECFGGFRFAWTDSYPLKERYAAYAASSHSSPLEALLAAIKKLGGSGLALGVDTGRMPVASYNQCVQALPGYSFSEGNDIFMKARMVKHPEEVAGIEKAAEVAEESLLAALGEYTEGMTEYQLQLAYERQVAARGAHPFFMVATANQRAAYSDTTNTAAPITKGSFIRFDYGCRIGGYVSDLARTASIGAPDAKVKAYYEAVKAGTNAAIGILKPGVTAGELFQMAVETTQKNGIPHYARHHVGHGIGLEAYDAPTLVAGSAVTVEAGMVFCIETPYYELGWGGVQVEDTLVVTAEGSRRLDKTSNELIIV